MESLEHAMKRDAPIIAEYLGGAVNCDAYHMTDPRSDGLGVWVYHPVSKRALKMQVLHLRRYLYDCICLENKSEQLLILDI